MHDNPAHRYLGLKTEDRAVIFHFDDLGMFQATLPAYAKLLDAGVLCSASVMVPCPWFSAVVNQFKANPRADIGVHLTLTSEWKTFRWGPVLRSPKIQSLVDAEGYFFRSVAELHRHARKAAAYEELKAQILRAQTAGLRLTHLDTHMGAVEHPKLIPAYLGLMQEFHLLGLVLNFGQSQWEGRGLASRTAKKAADAVSSLRLNGVPLIDNFASLPSVGTCPTFSDRLEQMDECLRNLPAGITHFALHPAVPSTEFDGIEEDLSARVRELEILLSPQFQELLGREAIRCISYADIRRGMSAQ